MTSLPIETRTAAWKPPTLTKSFARTVAKRLDKHWAQTGVKSLQDIRDALGSGIVAGMSMADRIDNQAAVKKWKQGLSKADLHKMFRMIEEIKNGKAREQYRTTDDALNRLRAASDDLLPSERKEILAGGYASDVQMAIQQVVGKLVNDRTIKKYLRFSKDLEGGKVKKIRLDDGLRMLVITLVEWNPGISFFVTGNKGGKRSQTLAESRGGIPALGSISKVFSPIMKAVKEWVEEGKDDLLKAASEQEAEKLQAEAEANEQQAEADRAKAQAAQMKEGARLDPRRLSDEELTERRNKLPPPGPRSGRYYSDMSIPADRAIRFHQEDAEMDQLDAEIKRRKLNYKWKKSGSDDDLLPSERAKQAAGGLYGYTKGTQRDVEASIRKAQRKAAAVARVLFAKDERSVSFLKAHAKRSNSSSARLILSAMKNLGPRVASDKTAGSGAANAKYLDSLPPQKKNKILKHIAKHYDVSVREIEDELTDRDAEALYEYAATDRAMAMEIYRDFKRQRLTASKTAAQDDTLPIEKAASIEAVDPNKYYVSTDSGDTYGPYRSKHDAGNVVDELAAIEVDAAVDKGDKVIKTVRKPKQFKLNTPAELKRHHLASVPLPIERVAAKDSAKKEWSRKDRKRKEVKKKVRQDQKKDLAQRQREKVAGGLYGFPTKTARISLVACSDLRAYIGEVAFGLHSRRVAKYDRITGFLKEHGKTARCSYSRMLLGCYPDGPQNKQAFGSELEFGLELPSYHRQNWTESLERPLKWLGRDYKVSIRGTVGDVPLLTLRPKQRGEGDEFVASIQRDFNKIVKAVVALYKEKGSPVGIRQVVADFQHWGGNRPLIQAIQADRKMKQAGMPSDYVSAISDNVSAVRTQHGLAMEGEEAAKALPEELKEHQFTSKDNPNPKGNDKDGDGKTNEPSPVKDKKAAGSEFQVSGDATLELLWSVKVEANDEREAKKKALDLVDRPGSGVEWSPVQGAGRVDAPTKSQLKEMARYEVADISLVGGKKAEHHEESKEKYPWDECVKDQMKEYGSKETAEKVCGKIKAESQGGKAASVPDTVEDWLGWQE